MEQRGSVRVNRKALEARLMHSGKALATVLAATRSDADLSQRQVAEKMGWDRNTVTKIEGGNRVVSMQEFIELCRIYQVDPLKVMKRVLEW